MSSLVSAVKNAFARPAEQGRGPVQLWVDRLRDSFWFVPTLFGVAAVVLGLVLPAFDAYLELERGNILLRWVFNARADGARAMCQAIATSGFGVAATVFSITIATLTLSSNQFGPRLLRTFVSDRGIQATMGTFVGCFLFPLLVLRTIRDPDLDGEGGFVPHLSVSVSVLYAVASVAVLVYFVHHVSVLIRAPHVIDAVGKELDKALDEQVPPDNSFAGDIEGLDASGYDVPDPPQASDRVVLARASDSGHITYVEESTLAAIAHKCGVTFWLAVTPGDYVHERTPLVVARAGHDLPDDDVRRKITDAVHVGDRRTLAGDVMFGIDQLTEIAQRAMSPGINDPFTCLTCVDRLTASLARVGGRAMPARVGFRDDDDDEDTHGRGAVRLVADRPLWTHAVRQAYDPIRRYAGADGAVMVRILRNLSRLAEVTPPQRHAALREQADAVMQAHAAAAADPLDLRTVRGVYEEVLGSWPGGATTAGKPHRRDEDAPPEAA